MQKRWFSFALACLVANAAIAIEQSEAVRHRLYTECAGDSDRSGAECHGILQLLLDTSDVKEAERIIEERNRRESQARFEESERNRKEALKKEKAAKEALKRQQARAAEGKRATEARNEATKARDEAMRAQAGRPDARIGMTMDQVITGTHWGRPAKVHRTTTAAGKREQWVYGFGRYLYFDNGVLTTIQD